MLMRKSKRSGLPLAGSGRALVAMAALLGPLLASPGGIHAAEYYVAMDGSDLGSGSQSRPWRTLQHAADMVGAGDVVTVLPGHYQGFTLFTSGTPTSPITFRAVDAAHGPNPAVVIDQNNSFTGKDLVNLEGASHVAIEGFTVLGSGDPATSRACIRTVGFPGNSAKFVAIRRNRCDGGGRWGVFTGFVDDLLIEDNETSNSAAEHGIYASNSGDRPVIRRNVIHGNHSNGIHVNGDASLGGDGVISNALIERNEIYDNGDGDPTFGAPGGSGINCDGMRDSIIRNNLLYANHKSGISLYRIDGGLPSANNLVVHNTVHMASDARWALNIQNGSVGNVIRNNILLNDHPTRGAIDIASNCLAGFSSDWNVVKDRFAIDGNFYSLAGWKTKTGQDSHSAISTPAATFAAGTAGAYDLHPDSPALDSGSMTFGVPEDLRGKPRPVGSGFDRGCIEHGSCLGGFSNYGTPLAGSFDETPTITATGCPDRGETFVVQTEPPLPGSPGLLFAGALFAQYPLAGGILWLVPMTSLPLSGSAQFGILVPDVPALSGVSFRFQAAYQDSAAVQGVALSDALLVTIG
jgi:hypothetical protein